MRVLHILNDVTDRGNGIVNAAVDIAIEQSRQGLVVAVASAGGGYEPLLHSAGVQHFKLNQARNPVAILRAALAFRKQLTEFRPDVVHAHMRTGMLLAWFWSHFQHFVLVSHVHNVHDRESIVMGLADRVIAVSRSVERSMAASGISERKLRTVLNRPLGNERVPPLSQIVPAQLKNPAIVTVGGMNDRKGIQELIVAFESVGKAFTEAHLYLVGDGPDRQKFEALAQRSSYNDRIHFEGFQATPQAYMQSADVFVLASRRESFGLVLTEAREAGCAIVATDVDGIAEALDGGRAGLLIPAQNVVALSEALISMLSSGEERERWQRRARRGIEEYSVGAMVNEVGSVYEELLREKRCNEYSGAASL